jgi:hypothetical protein
MALNKVEICGVNTSKLPVLKAEEKEQKAEEKALEEQKKTEEAKKKEDEKALEKQKKKEIELENL